jgi:hypothetical protein
MEVKCVHLIAGTSRCRLSQEWCNRFQHLTCSFERAEPVEEKSKKKEKAK